MPSTSSHIAEPVKWRTTLITGGIMLLFLPLISFLTSLQIYGFCLPAATISAAFLGVPCVPHPDGYMLASEVLPTCVTTACSAAHFFILMTALACGVFYDGTRSRGWRHLLATISACYGIALLANVTRIVLGWQVGVWARATISHSYWKALHLGVGVLIFVSFLVITYGLVWRLHYERRDEQETVTA